MPARMRLPEKRAAATWREVLLHEVLPGVDVAGGRRLTAGEGLIYFNARYYDPLTGRFLTEDPSRKGVNWYAYCENNPVNRIDPSGRATAEMVLSEVESFFSSAGEELSGVGSKLGVVGAVVAIGGFAMEHVYPKAIENIVRTNEVYQQTVVIPIVDLLTSGGRQQGAQVPID